MSNDGNTNHSTFRQTVRDREVVNPDGKDQRANDDHRIFLYTFNQRTPPIREKLLDFYEYVNNYSTKK